MTELPVGPREVFVATRDILGWNGERILTGMRAPVDDWPDDYVAHLVAEGTLQIEQIVDAEIPRGPDFLDVAGEATRPPLGGEAS